MLTATKRNVLKKLLEECEVPFTIEQVTCATQSNAVDCGQFVVSFIHDATNSTTIPAFKNIVPRTEMYKLAVDSLPQVILQA